MKVVTNVNVNTKSQIDIAFIEEAKIISPSRKVIAGYITAMKMRYRRMGAVRLTPSEDFAKAHDVSSSRLHEEIAGGCQVQYVWLTNKVHVAERGLKDTNAGQNDRYTSLGEGRSCPAVLEKCAATVHAFACRSAKA